MGKNVAIVYLSSAIAWLITLVIALSVTLADGKLGSILISWFVCGVVLVFGVGVAATAEYVMLKEYE